MKFSTLSTSLLSVIALILVAPLSGCGKSVQHAGGARFGQEEPGDGPGTDPTDPTDPSAGRCEPAVVGEALAHSVYVRTSATLEDTKVRRKVAGVDLSLDSSQVGFALSPDRSRIDLTASNALDLSSSKILHGRAVYGSSVRSPGSSAYGGISADSSIDLGPGWAKVLSFSRACSETTPNATATKVCECADSTNSPNGSADGGPGCLAASPKTCRLVITSSRPGLNIARITNDQVEGIERIDIDLPASATLVANLPDLRTASFEGVRVKIVRSLSIDRAYWNLPQGQKLGFEGTGFFGTVVAPWASATVVKNDGNGSFWTESAEIRQSVF